MNKKILILALIMLNTISSSYGWYASIIPVTKYNGEWYGLFGHQAGKNLDEPSWTDFQRGSWISRDPKSLAISNFNEQTNNFFNWDVEYLKEFGALQKRGYDDFFFVNYFLPKDKDINNIEDDLRAAADKPDANKLIDDYAWFRIDSIISGVDNKFNDTEYGRGVSVVDVIKESWAKIEEDLDLQMLSQHGIPRLPQQRKPSAPQQGVPDKLSGLLAELKSKLDELKKLLTGTSSAETEKSQHHWLEWIGYTP